MRIPPYASLHWAVGWLCLLTLPAIGAVSNQPLTTADEVAAHLGRQAVVEFTVVEVKHPRRRKALFLSSSANFRGEQTVSVMIRDADLPHFSDKDEADLARRYSGRRIRVNGDVARDEGQLVVHIATADQIQITAEAPRATTKPADLVLTKEDGQQLRWTADELSKLPPECCQIEHEGKRLTYSGISLAAVLKYAGIVLGEESRGRQLNRYVLVSASDGYQALLSVAEVDPYLRSQIVLLANQCDGQSLDETEGPWRLIVKDDLHQRRWVRSVVAIDVRQVDAPDKSRPTR